LVDTQRSGRCTRKGVGVRVPPSAPPKNRSFFQKTRVASGLLWGHWRRFLPAFTHNAWYTPSSETFTSVQNSKVDKLSINCQFWSPSIHLGGRIICDWNHKFAVTARLCFRKLTAKNALRAPYSPAPILPVPRATRRVLPALWWTLASQGGALPVPGWGTIPVCKRGALFAVPHRGSYTSSLPSAFSDMP